MDESKVLEAIASYITKLQEYSDTKFQSEYPNAWKNGQAPKFSYERTKKWLKISGKAAGSNSPFAFIDPANGDIYKPATWNTAAKGVRANLFDAKLPMESGQLYR